MSTIVLLLLDFAPLCWPRLSREVEHLFAPQAATSPPAGGCRSPTPGKAFLQGRCRRRVRPLHLPLRLWPLVQAAAGLRGHRCLGSTARQCCRLFVSPLARTRHGHGQRSSSYLRLLAADSSPKYQPGQSCRKVKRKELRLQTEDEDCKSNVAEGLEEEQERSDCTVCTDEQHGLDDEESQDGRGSCGDGRVKDGNERYTVEYEKDWEMERVLEKQAELIGQFEAQENAQREWEKKFNGSRDLTSDDVEQDNKLKQNEKACELMGRAAQIITKELVCEEAQSRNKDLCGVNSPSECLLNGSASGLSSNAPEARAVGKCKESDKYFRQGTAVVASVDSKLHVRKDELVHKSYTEIIEGSVYDNLGRSVSSPQKSYSSSSNAGHNKGQEDGKSDSGSSYHANARSYEHYVTTPSVGSPLSDTPKSKMSEWSSSCFHNHTDNQIDMQPLQFSSDDVGGVHSSPGLSISLCRESSIRVMQSATIRFIASLLH